jgi:glycosyltransferase involved in cell wall biosynthesis
MRIRVCTPLRSHMGYAELGRILVNQLLRAGHDVSTTEIDIQRSDADFGPLAAQALALRERHAAAEINIINMIPDWFEKARLPGAVNIGYTMFEADRLPDAWVAACNRMDAIWVPSAWVRGVFVASGVTVPVTVIGIDAAPLPQADAPEGPFRLLSVFQWSARKNPVGLLRAYCAAFDGDDSVVLTLKTHRDEDAEKSARFVGSVVDFTMARMKPRRFLPRVEIATPFYSAAQMQQLHASSHAFVSLSHAEGWGLPAWDASLAGRPVVHTAYSSPTEFVHPQGLVRSHLTPVYGMQDFANFYDIGMCWGEPDLDRAATLLRDLKARSGYWREQAAAHRLALQERYSLPRRLEALEAALTLSQRTGG